MDWKSDREKIIKDFKITKWEIYRYHADYILGQVIYFPENRDFIFRNCPSSVFRGKDYMAYETARELHSKGTSFTLLHLIDSNPNLSYSYLSKLGEGILKLNYSSIEHSIKRLKELEGIP